MKMTESQQREVFGTTIEMIKLHVERNSIFQTTEQIVVSILSDVQHEMEFDMECARQMLNVAKYILLEMTEAKNGKA